MKSTKIGIIVTLIAILLLLGATTSKAVVQSSGGAVASYDINNWMINIRNMEKIGGGFGLSETLNGDLTSSSGSNNIDIHMEKNTEYGGLAILSASSYGNPNKINSGETTTGNETGAIMNINQEWVAAGTLASASTYYNAAGKYKCVYTYNYVAKNGDAISETAGWHGSTSSQWLYARGNDKSGHPYDDYSGSSNTAGVLRSYAGSIFSYYGCGWDQYLQKPYDAYYGQAHPTRCIVIVGEGI